MRTCSKYMHAPDTYKAKASAGGGGGGSEWVKRQCA